MEQVIRTGLGWVIPVVELAGALVILSGAARAFVRYVRLWLRRNTRRVPLVRLQFGQSLVMGLEFQVAADILKTALAPSWSDLARLATVIAIRTVLNYVLEHELHTLDHDAHAAISGDSLLGEE
jgi:uncharacterized membrane protein